MIERITICVALLGLSLRLFGCNPPTAAEKTVGAAALYEEQQRACVQQYADTAHIDACRDKVKKAWATDAGKDGAQ